MSSKSKMRLLLLPFSWLYGLVIWCRNMMFEIGILNSTSYDIPVISIGNITIGGTGKTPHTEYLAKLFGKDYQVAVLSRGYKRASKGFLLAGPESGLNDLGDEPLQMKRKFPELVVAVDKNRQHGIEMLSADTMSPRIDVILLDDAYQHRYVKPAISILLIDYNRLIMDDYLLPVGCLREPAHQSKRAHIIIVTKCPETLRPIEIRILKKRFDLYPQQSIYLTSLTYGPLKSLKPVLANTDTDSAESYSDQKAESHSGKMNSNGLTIEQISEKKIPVLIISGIASPEPFVNHVREYCPEAQVMLYSDHHYFSKKDVQNIKLRFENIRSAGGIILTTEKDSMRIMDNSLFEVLLPYMYYQELNIFFLEDEVESFNKKIIDYVRINKRNSKLVSSTDAK